MEKTEKKIEMGGQAVIEGVMMRSPMGYSIAVRKKDKTIKIKSIPYKPITKRIKVLGLPFLRGVVTLFEMLIIGLKGLDFSVNEWEGQEGKKPDEKSKENPGDPAESSRAKNDGDLPTEKRQISGLGMAGLMMFSLALAMVLTVVVPNLLAQLVGLLPIFGKTRLIDNVVLKP